MNRSSATGLRAGSVFHAELESLRGIAILLVVVYHLAGQPVWFGYPKWPLAHPFIDAGHSGVTLFFVLSAFLLAMPFLRERGASGWLAGNASSSDARCVSFH